MAPAMGPFSFHLAANMKIITWLFLPVFYVMCMIAPGAAYAQNVYSGTQNPSTVRAINNIIRNTPGMNALHVPGRTTVTSAATDFVNKTPGLRIPVPASATATATAGRIAGMAARALRVGSFIGAATFVIPWIADQYGIKVCPPPDFFCKPGPGEVATPDVPNSWTRDLDRKPYPSPRIGCEDQFKTDSTVVAGPPSKYERRLTFPTNKTAKCELLFKYDNGSYLTNSDGSPKVWSTILFTYQGNMVCPDGYVQSGGTCLKAGPPVPATETDLATAMQQAMEANQQAQESIYNGTVANGIPVFGLDDPVTVSAPQVQTQPQVQTDNVVDANGNSITRTTTQQSTVKPVVNGTTLGNTTITYPTTTTTIINNYNNTTNVQAPPIINTGNENATPEKPQEIEFPKDYNKEVTQVAILKALQGEGITTKVDTNVDPYVKPVTDATKANTDAIDKIAPANYGIAAWFPQIPTTECKNVSVPNAIGSGKSEIDICTPISTFKTFISGVICFFVLVACVREVQSALKA